MSTHKTSKSPKRDRRELAGGGEIFLNKTAKGWSIDMWDLGYAKGDEPSYHAYYDNEEDARTDLASWKVWEY